jgi:hypothetical protein
MTANYGAMLISLIFSIYMLSLAYLQLRAIRLEKKAALSVPHPAFR